MPLDAAILGCAVRTACPYCGVGCGVLATKRSDGGADIAGDPEHPANFGRLCSKGSALGETLSLDDRLLYPHINGQRASWDAALDLVAAGFQETIAAHGPDSVAFYVSGQILTEDYYAANKLMKGFIGSANIDTNSRLCMASSVAGHKRAFGADTVPGTYQDLELADLVVLVGSNLAWCHPILYQRLATAKEKRGTKVVVIDPRQTATTEIADLHLALAPGSDVALFNGLLAHLERSGSFDHAYIDKHTTGLAAALDSARDMSDAQVAAVTGLDADSVAAFYEMFSRTERAVTVYSQGVNQSSAGTDKVNAIINCHLATGRIGKEGMGPFSVTGQPNAMGGREVGGLANMLAAHMELGNPEHRRIVQSFWGSPAIADKPGLKAVDMFEGVADGRIKAIWIMATNPVDSMPDADRVVAALQACPFVAVSDVTAKTDTTMYARVLLPSTAWGEKDGTVTNSERVISRQRQFLPLPGDAKPDWWQITEVAKRMGFQDAFAWQTPAQIFEEYARLTGFENGGARDLDVSAHAGITRDDYERLAPFQWPQEAGRNPGTTRFFADGNFYTPDARARFVQVVHRSPVSVPSEAYPFVLNTGRIRDQWHTMTRTGKAARLMNHIAEPFVEIHPEDAAALGLQDASLCRIENTHGHIVVRVLITTRQRKGSLFVPMHWTDQFASNARVDKLIPGITDPVSGQPELKAAAVAVRPYAAAWYGFAVTERHAEHIAADYWAIAPAKAGFRLELAGENASGDWEKFSRDLITADGNGGELLAYHDAAAEQHRFAAFCGDRFVGAIYISPRPVAVTRTFIADRLGTPISNPGERFALLAGRPGGTTRDRGAIVCSCLDVGQNEIVDAILQRGCRSVSDVGKATNAGTNCGSCRSEIGRLIHAQQLSEAV